jgi:hypothetical protein
VNREFHPQGITLPLGDKLHPWGTTSPLGAKLRMGLSCFKGCPGWAWERTWGEFSKIYLGANFTPRREVDDEASTVATHQLKQGVNFSVGANFSRRQENPFKNSLLGSVGIRLFTNILYAEPQLLPKRVCFFNMNVPLWMNVNERW